MSSEPDRSFERHLGGDESFFDEATYYVDGAGNSEERLDSAGGFADLDLDRDFDFDAYYGGAGNDANNAGDPNDQDFGNRPLDAAAVPGPAIGIDPRALANQPNHPAEGAPVLLNPAAFGQSG